MPKILVIADDFTGAAEIGGIAHLFGLSVKMETGLSGPGETADDVVVIDTNTRSFSPEKAYLLVKSLLKDQDLSAFDFIYKKVDSVLRGPIASEIEAILTIANLDQAVLVPANPSKDRTIKNGKYYINGVSIDKTEFKNDPEYPRNSPFIKDLIIENIEKQASGPPIKEHTLANLEIPDACSTNNLVEIVRTRLTKYSLAAGGADFFTAIMMHKYKLKESIKASYTPGGGRRHFIIGTRSLNGISTINTLQAKGYTCFYLPVQSLEQEKVYNTYAQEISKIIDKGQALIVARPENELAGLFVLQRIVQLLSKTAGVLINKSKSGDEIFIEGGETASTIIRNQDTNLRIREVLGAGVVKLELNNSGICLIVKPGSYPWPENVFKPSIET
jgi:uncharacterized protein YgbK (DUF1537 family)